MINRENWKETRQFLDYLRDVKQDHDKTVNRARVILDDLLGWADETGLCDAMKVRPVFPQWAAQQGKSKRTLDKMCATVRQFYAWARRNLKEYRSITEAWIETIRPAKAQSMQSQVITHELYTLEEVRLLVGVEDKEHMGVMRDKAAVAFLFLSGMRADAFVTLPIECVDLNNLKVSQLPDRGVRTKNSKAAMTFLLDIPDLMAVVRKWDERIRGKLPGDSAWYARLTAFGLAAGGAGEVQRQRTRILRDAIKELCEKAGIEYKSPHKFRHGHATYGIKNAKTIAELKAISQNLMHANLGITDGIYAVLSPDDIQQAIRGLGNDKSQVDDLINKLLDGLKANPEIMRKLKE